MKILLVNPPKSPQSIAPDDMEPLALEVLAATLPQHEVRILDLRFEPAIELFRCLESFQPRLVGVSVNNTIHVRAGRQVLRRIRAALPSANLVVGGHHPTLVPRDFYSPETDAVFRGWAEKSFPEYVRALEAGEACGGPGVIVLRGGRPVNGSSGLGPAEAADLPLPRRDLTQRYRRRYRDELGRRTFLVNTARGGIVDEAALGAAIRSGRLAGAGLDVLVDEPLKPDHPLAGIPNVILTPHVAGVTEEGMINMAVTAAEDVLRVLRGESPKYPVNPHVLAQRGSR